MAKEVMKLEISEMFAIKHALQHVVKDKNNRLQEICEKEPQTWDNEIEQEVNRLNWDISKENALIVRFDEKIGDLQRIYGIGRK